MDTGLHPPAPGQHRGLAAPQGFVPETWVHVSPSEGSVSWSSEHEVGTPACPPTLWLGAGKNGSWRPRPPSSLSVPISCLEELGSLMACSPPRAGYSAGPFPAMGPHFIPKQAHRAGVTTHSTDVKPRKVIQQGGQGHLPAQNMSLRRLEPQFPYL